MLILHSHFGSISRTTSHENSNVDAVGRPRIYADPPDLISHHQHASMDALPSGL